MRHLSRMTSSTLFLPLETRRRGKTHLASQKQPKPIGDPHLPEHWAASKSAKQAAAARATTRVLVVIFHPAIVRDRAAFLPFCLGGEWRLATLAWAEQTKPSRSKWNGGLSSTH